MEKGNYNYANVKRWVNKVEFFELDKIFIPINISNTHWVLVVIQVQLKRISFYDSGGGCGLRFMKNIRKWIEDVAVQFCKEINISEWKMVNEISPKQTNGFDCGMFVIMVADYISDGLPLKYITQAHMSENRIKVAAAILKKIIKLHSNNYNIA
jgi:sentrin-specific protease 1